MKKIILLSVLLCFSGCATTLRQEFSEQGVDSNGDYYESKLLNAAKAGPFSTQTVELQEWDWKYGPDEHLKAGQTGVNDNSGQIEAVKVMGETIGQVADTITAVIGLPPEPGDTEGRASWIGALLQLVGNDSGLFNTMLQYFFK